MKKLFRKAYDLLAQAAKARRERALDAYSAQAAFFTFISLVPVCALAFGIIKILPADLSEFYARISPMLPPLLHSFISLAYEAADSADSAAVIALSAVVWFYTASRGIYSVTRGVRSAYGGSGSGGIKLRLGSLLYTLAFVAMLLVSALLLVFGNRIVLAVRRASPEWLDIGAFNAFVRSAAALVLLFLAHLAAYRFIPEKRSTLIASLPGALCASALWMAASFFYSVYIDWYADSAVSLYGGLAAAVLLLLWLYACMSATLTGGLINSLLAERASRRPDAASHAAPEEKSAE